MKDSIPANVRQAIYWAFFIVGLVIGSFQAFVAATGGIQPDWVTGALAILGYAGSALGLQAAVYTPSKKSGPIAIEPEVAEPMIEESAGKRFADPDSDIPSSLM